MTLCKLAACVAVIIALGSVEGMPLMQEATVPLGQGLRSAALVQVAETQAPEQTLLCHEVADQAEKAKCCVNGLKEWREKQVLYKDLQDTEMRLLTAPEKTAELQSGFDQAESAWESSQTKLTYEQGIRDCATSPSAYQLPPTSAA